MQPIQPRNVPELEEQPAAAKANIPVDGAEPLEHRVEAVLEHHSPEAAPENEIVGRPTLLAKYAGRLDAQQILDALGQVGYPLNDVSVLFKLAGSDEVVDLVSGQIAAGQSLTEKELERFNQKHGQNGQTAVLLHPEQGQFAAVKQALEQIGQVDIEYAGETHAYGRPGGVAREDEQPT